MSKKNMISITIAVIIIKTNLYCKINQCFYFNFYNSNIYDKFNNQFTVIVFTSYKYVLLIPPWHFHNIILNVMAKKVIR